MASALNAFVLFAAEQADVGGRGDNPGEGTGIITIVVIVALVLVAGLALAFVFTRGRARRRSLERHPDRGGSVAWLVPHDSAGVRLGFAVKVLGDGGLPSHDTRRWQSGPHLRTSLERLRAVLAYLIARTSACTGWPPRWRPTPAIPS